MNMMRRVTKRGEIQGEPPKREREVPTRITIYSLRSRSMMWCMERVAQSNSASSVIVLTMTLRSILIRSTKTLRTINRWRVSIRGLISSWWNNMWNKGIQRGLRTDIISSFLRTHLVCMSYDYLIREVDKKRMCISNSSLISGKAVLPRFCQLIPRTMCSLSSCKRGPCSIQFSRGT